MNPLARPEMILIDLDGTLVDSVPDLAFCVDAMMTDLGLPARGEAEVRNWVGNGVERLIHRALTQQLQVDAPAEQYDRALPLFLQHYRENTSQRSVLYPGVAEGLTQLRDAGYRLGCVTNKPAEFTLPLLKDLGIRPYFEIVVSGDTLPRKKPDPAPLFHAAAQLGVAPTASLMVGDSRSDVQAARAAGFAVVCMSYGYNHGKDIRDEHPDAVLDRLDALPGLLPARGTTGSGT